MEQKPIARMTCVAQNPEKFRFAVSSSGIPHTNLRRTENSNLPLFNTSWELLRKFILRRMLVGSFLSPCSSCNSLLPFHFTSSSVILHSLYSSFRKSNVLFQALLPSPKCLSDSSQLPNCHFGICYSHKDVLSAPSFPISAIWFCWF